MNFVFVHRTFCIKMSLLFHDPEIEHFGELDSIASNAAFSLVTRSLSSYASNNTNLLL